MSVELACTVRGCGARLERAGARWVCAAGHSFDVARSGYLNLLQPQDRRSREPGDTRESIAARGRLWRAGLFDALAERLDERSASAGSLADVGCGSGELLGRIAHERPAAGIDLSVAAITIAARALPALTWVVANADRGMPLASGSVDCLLSVTAVRHPLEFRRVLAPRGRALVVVPAPDDLVELRELLCGEGRREDRASAWIERFEPHFELVLRETIDARKHCSAAELADLARSTYRAGRAGREERLASISALDVTHSFELLVFE